MSTGAAAAVGAPHERGVVRTVATSPEAFVVLMIAYVFMLLFADKHVDLAGQMALGVITWLVLAVALWPRSHTERAATIGVVVVSIGGECLASLVLGLYTYRLENIPLFVPPGHGLLYLSALTASRMWVVRRWPAAWIVVVAVAGTVWSILGLTVLPQRDLLGALAWLIFLYFLWIGNSPIVYASAFWAVTYLELTGTTIGNWEWNPDSFGLSWFPCGNPPAGAPAGYVLFEIGAFMAGPWIYYTLRARIRRRA